MKRIENILKEIGIPIFGACDFDKDHLIECRNKRRIPENAQSIIMTAFPYRLPDEFYKDRNISRYAVVWDYHDVLGMYLEKAVERLKEVFPEHGFIAFTDNSPVYEVQSAVRAGLGVRGDNGLLITKDYGSWVFLGEIVTTMKLECMEHHGECLHCGKCRDICNAVTGNKKESCLSAITQKKGELSDAEKQKIINFHSAWGCDLCQEICPMNENKNYTTTEEFISFPKAKISVGDSLEKRAYAWRGQAVIDRNLSLLGKEV